MDGKLLAKGARAVTRSPLHLAWEVLREHVSHGYLIEVLGARADIYLILMYLVCSSVCFTTVSIPCSHSGIDLEMTSMFRLRCYLHDVEDLIPAIEERRGERLHALLPERTDDRLDVLGDGVESGAGRRESPDRHGAIFPQVADAIGDRQKPGMLERAVADTAPLEAMVEDDATDPGEVAPLHAGQPRMDEVVGDLRRDARPRRPVIGTSG
jgi:hypothetical protein